MRKQTAMINRNAELTWIGSGPKIGRSYTLLDDGRPTGIQIRHCGHPTALWPYYITRRPEEGMFLHANGKAFYLLSLAKQAAEALYLGRCHILPIECRRYHVAGMIAIQR